MARYLIVRVETDEAFTAIRRALHDFSRDTGEKLTDMGTNMMPIADKWQVELAFDDAVQRAKRFND